MFARPVICGAGRFTVTLQVAVLPFEVFTVIVAVPAFLAVTLPLLSTVATLVFELLQVHFLFAAFDGYTVALRFEVFPVSSVKVVLLRATEVGTTCNCTKLKSLFRAYLSAAVPL